MKAKRLFALLLSFVMVISLLPGTALAAGEPQIEVRLTEETLADKDGIAVELMLTTGTNWVGALSTTIVYDRNMLELVDIDGNAVALTEEYKSIEKTRETADGPLQRVEIVDDPYLSGNPAQPTFEWTCCEDSAFVRPSQKSLGALFGGYIGEDLAGLAIVRISASSYEFPADTVVSKLFLALKEGADAYEAAESIRLATYEEADKLGQSSVVYVQDDYFNVLQYGTENGAEDTEGFADCVTVNNTIEAPAPHEHDWGTGVVTTEATCTTDGVKTYTCECGETKTEAVPATGHTEVVDEAVAATCTTDGKTEGKHCSVCNEVIVAQETVPATGHAYDDDKDATCNNCGEVRDVSCAHVWDEGVITTEATCTIDGVKTFTCSECGATKTEAIPATGHTEVVDEAVAATCTTDGKTEGKHCSVCNEVIVAQETVPATGHVYDNDEDANCNVCGNERPVTVEAVYLGVENYAEANGRNKDSFKYRFAVNGEEAIYAIENIGGVYALQNQLQNGYIYNISIAAGIITDVELLDKGHEDVVMGTVTKVTGTAIYVDGVKVALTDAIYEIESPVAASGAVVNVIDAVAVGDTVKCTENAIYKAFVAEEYEAPLSPIPGKKTLKNFLTTALTPVGTALYVYGGAWDWQDNVSSNQTMTIGIPQSWIDFYQSQDTSYTYRQRVLDENGNQVLDEDGDLIDDLANSYYWRRYNEFYWAGVDCSAYVGWVVYNTMNTESVTVSESEGYVGSATAQANRFAVTEGWGTFDIGHYQMNEDGTYYADGDGDCRRYFNSEDFNVGDVFSDNGHVWIVIGKCDDGSIVFTHSTPSDSVDGQPGGGIQLAALDPNDDPNCEAKALADYYNAKYFPEWNERYGTDQKSWSTYTKVYDTGTPADGDDYSMTKAGKFSWDLENGPLSDPQGYTDMTAAEILADIFGENKGGSSGGSSSKPSIREDVEVTEPETTETTYTDVPETHWAYEAIEAVTEAGLFNGTSATTFSPEMDTTRGQLMTVLARLSGEKAATIAEGVAWAVESGVSDGTNPEANITREQLVTMLYRYAQLKGVDVSVGENTNILSYDDAASVSEWAIAAMQWACGEGIIKGMTESTLVPGGYATRAQIATIMQRYAGL